MDGDLLEIIIDKVAFKYRSKRRQKVRKSGQSCDEANSGLWVVVEAAAVNNTTEYGVRYRTLIIHSSFLHKPRQFPLQGWICAFSVKLHANQNNPRLPHQQEEGEGAPTLPETLVID